MKRNPFFARFRSLPVFLLVPACLISAAAFADDPQAPPPVAAPAPAAPTRPMPLQEMLSHVAKPDQGSVFCLDAAHTPPVDPNHPEDALKPTAQPFMDGPHVGDPGPFTLRDAQSNYDRMIQHIGDLAVLAPAHMVVLNTDLGKPDLYEGLEPGDAFKLLLATLSNEQWTALQSKQGLAVSDLSSDNQQHLMLHVLGGHGAIVLHPEPRPDDGDAKLPSNIDITDKLAKLHIRLVKQVTVNLPDGGGYSNDGYPGTAAPAYVIWYSQNSATLEGHAALATVAAMQKPGDLDYADSRWDAPVSVQDSMTLAQLMVAVSFTSHSNLYCDKRMEALPVTLLSKGKVSYRCGDLLQAAALCVTGTYRQVGTAYVLTNDVVGLGTRVQLLTRYHDTADKQRYALLNNAADAFVTKHPFNAVPYNDNASLAITAEQWKKNIGDGPDMPDSTRVIAVPMAELTPAQRAGAHAVYDYMKAHPEPDLAQPNSPTLNGKVFIMETPSVVLTLDGMQGTIALNGDFNSVFRMSEVASSAAAAAFYANAPAEQPKQSVPTGPSLSQALAAVRRRATMVRVSSPEQLPGIIQNMKRLGLNQLWLDVFSSGTSHMMAQDNKHKPVNLVARAVQLGAPAGIHVYAVADLYQWGSHAAPDLADRTIVGETSAEAMRDDPLNPPPPTALLPEYVSPIHPQVVQALATLHKQLGLVRGLGGLVWRDTDPPGYLNQMSNTNLGYTVPTRLAFLRTEHADPIDVMPQYGSFVDTTMPFLSTDWGIGQTLIQKWRTFLSNQNSAVLTGLRAAALPGKSALQNPLFVEERSNGGAGHWFGTWDSPTAPLPRMHYPWDDIGTAATYPSEPVKQAKAQSRIAMWWMRTWPGITAAALAQNVTLEFAQSQWDGVVLEAPMRLNEPFDASAVADAKWLSDLAAPEAAPAADKRTLAP